MTAVVDCGSGNLRSVVKALERFIPDARVTDNPAVVAVADRLVLPGQGAFGNTVRQLTGKNLWEPIQKFLRKERPFLGICLGMQLLFSESEEKGRHPGLSLFRGRVIRFPDSVKVPQIGWNQVSFRGDAPLFRGLPENAWFYFVHSYYVLPNAPPSGGFGITRYGIDYLSAVAQGAVAGIQFHPEKSQRWGLKIIENFCNL